MLRVFRGAMLALAMTTAAALTACAAGSSEPTTSRLGGSWVGDFNDYDFQLSLTERNGAVTGNGKYIVGTNARTVNVTGTASPTAGSIFDDGGEQDFSLILSGDGVPTTTIKGTTSRANVGGAVVEVLASFVSNAQIGSDVYVVFVRP
ncbi:MAG TPA: hypothetical protein VIP11_03155 [Gemmatimonadaceae bacterium]